MDAAAAGVAAVGVAVAVVAELIVVAAAAAVLLLAGHLRSGRFDLAERQNLQSLRVVVCAGESGCCLEPDAQRAEFEP